MISSATNLTTTPPPRPWWLELLLADFRHAVWPWVVYLFACALFSQLPALLVQDGTPVQWIWVVIIMAIAVPAVISGIFTTDFEHATVQSLLTFPRQRTTIWLARMILLLVLLMGPLLLAIILISGSNEPILRIFTMFLLQGLYCYVTFGPLIAILLHKRLLSWSAILISPLVLLLAAVVLQHVVNYTDPDTFAKTFPWLPPFLFWFFIITGIPAALYAWLHWLRMEVQS